MKKFLSILDKAVGFILLNLGGLFTAAAFLLVLYTVLCRYLLHINTGGIDEFTTYFVVCSVWVGAVLCSRNLKSGQIRIDFMKNLVKNKTITTIVDIIWQIIAVAASGFFCYLTYTYVAYQIKKGTVLSGIKFPMAVFSGLMLVCVALITIYEFRRMVVLIQDLTGNKNSKEKEAAK